MRLNAGEIKEGKLADIILLNLRGPSFIPNHNLTSNIVYAANGSYVDTTICDGKVIMKEGKIEGEEVVMDKANDAAQDLIKRSLEE